MATNLKLVQPRTPRPYLAIVTALQLDSVQVPEDTKSIKVKVKDMPAPSVAGNDGSIPESGRNNALMSMAGVMRHKGMTEEAINAALQAENLARCFPPLEPAEVASIATSVMRYAAADPEVLMKSLNDTGNATRLGLRHAGRVIYVPGQGWMIWDGLQWHRDEVDRVMELAKQLSRSIYEEGASLTDNDAQIGRAHV